jgi:hypothetical protein
MRTTFMLDDAEFERMQKALERFPGNAEDAVNEVLHGDGATLIKDSIRQLIPVSGRTWKGKAAPASEGNSLTSVPGNLSVTTKTTKRYQYLYFPDDGTNTRRHVGNQQFFPRGAENVSSEIADVIIDKVTSKFEKGE